MLCLGIYMVEVILQRPGDSSISQKFYIEQDKESRYNSAVGRNFGPASYVDRLLLIGIKVTCLKKIYNMSELVIYKKKEIKWI